MIHVVYDRNRPCVTVKGHAGCGEYGKDPVCAAVSILVHTLAENVTKMEAEQRAQKCVVDMESGDAEISCKPIQRCKYTIVLMFDAVCKGFELLGRDYPEYLHYEVRD